jgi:N-acetylglucosamine-6-phosphate deacetylase
MEESMQLTLRGARLVDAAGDRPGGDITIEGTHIQAVGRARSARGRIVDASDAIVTPGFIDVHTHGGGGFMLHTADPEEILAYARWAPSTGTTGFLVAIVGVPDGLPVPQLAAAVAAFGAGALGAEPLGIFLEGPYISPARRGAHAASWLRTPDGDETERILSLAAGRLRLVTLAPELPGAPDTIRRLVEARVTVSIGHSDASYEQTREAILLGVNHATHCFNAMRPLQHRDPGPIGALVEAPQVFGEIIADGVHVHPAAMRVLMRALGPERTIVITDAQAGAGMPGATFEFAGQPARVVDGAARLADGTIAGSILTMDQALRNVFALGGVSLSEAVGMLSLNPARAIGADDRKGRLRSGYDADLLIFDMSLTLQATFCCGQLAFATEAWRERLQGD